MHAAHAVDHFGCSLGAYQIAANARGYRDLLTWARALGIVVQVGIEGPATTEPGRPDTYTLKASP